MDTLSTSLSSSVKHGASSTRDSIFLLKPSSLFLPSATSLSFHTTPKPKQKAQAQVQPSVSKPKTFLSPFASSKLKTTHNRAATGYAAALADAASHASALSDADFDACRLIGFVRANLVDPTLDEFGKAAKVIKVINGGGFEKHVVAIIKLLVKKGKIGLIEEVMTEFLRICDELTGTKTVVVGPSKARMESSKLERIARDVQRFNGASRVKILHAFVV